MRHSRIAVAAFLVLGWGWFCASAYADLDERQARLLSNNCLQCHARPGIGSPLMGNADDWKARTTQGMEKMLANVVVGLRGMPPLGYCSACNEADLRALTRIVSGIEEAAK